MKRQIAIVSKTYFDSLENHVSAAVVSEVVTAFVDYSRPVVEEKARRFIESDQSKTYKGWDGRAYPYFSVQVIEEG